MTSILTRYSIDRTIDKHCKPLWHRSFNKMHSSLAHSWRFILPLHGAVDKRQRGSMWYAIFSSPVIVRVFQQSAPVNFRAVLQIFSRGAIKVLLSFVMNRRRTHPQRRPSTGFDINYQLPCDGVSVQINVKIFGRTETSLLDMSIVNVDPHSLSSSLASLLAVDQALTEERLNTTVSSTLWPISWLD